MSEWLFLFITVLSSAVQGANAAKGYKLNKFNMFIFPSIKATIPTWFPFILVE